MGTSRILGPADKGGKNGSDNVPATRDQGGAPARNAERAVPANVERVANALGTSPALAEFLKDKNEIARFAVVAVNFYRDQITRAKDSKTRDQWAAINPENYVLACLDAARDGLVPGKQGYMIPYGSSVDWQPSWHGLLILARRHNAAIEDIAIEIVYRQEIEAGCFRVNLSAKTLEHVPWYSSSEAMARMPKDDAGMTIPPDERDIAACYTIATIRGKDGRVTRPFRILSVHELLKRADASGPRDKPEVWSGAWNQWFESMCRAKTFKAWCDWVEMPNDILDVIARDDDRELRRVEQIHRPAAPILSVEPRSIAGKVRDAAPTEPSEDERQPGEDPEDAEAVT